MALRGVQQLCFVNGASEIRQGLKILVSTYEARVDAIVRKATTSLEAKSDTSCGDLFKKTFGCLADADGHASLASAELTLPALVSGDGEVRAASSEAKKQLQHMWARTYSRTDLYKCLEAAQSGARTAEEERLVQQVLGKFRQAGAALPNADVRSKLSEIDARCATLAFDIEQNINEDCSEELFTDTELSGCSEAFIHALPQSSAIENGEKPLRRCSMKAPVLLPIMQRATSAEVRRKMLAASQKRCLDKNGPLLEELLSKRHEAAQVLGFPNHAERMLSSKMAKSAGQAEKFCTEMFERIRALRDSEMEKLRLRKFKDEGRKRKHASMVDSDQIISECEIDAWDVSFYSDLLKQEELSFDDEYVKQFFPLVDTIEKVLAFYSEFLGLSFHKSKTLPRWHDEVVAFEVRQGDSVIGHLYLDQFPRDGKFGHQMILPLAPSFVDSETGERCVPACVNISNLPRPQGEQPALLRFQEMVTLFHELGHAMHCLCTTTQFSLLSWAWPMVPWPGGVEQDFLEVPSMALEKFACEPEFISRVAQHFSNDPAAPKFPEETLTTIKALERWMFGMQQSRFFAMALFDLKAHSQAPPYTFEDKVGISAQELYACILEKYTKLSRLPGTHPCASWYHLVIGYDAGYYGYAWSDVYAADLFKAMLTSPPGLLSAKTGALLKDEILGPCATRGGFDMLKKFLGRDPSTDAWCERKGIAISRM